MADRDPNAKSRHRLDQALVERGLCASREKAKRTIMAGQVRINKQLAHKPSDPVKANDEITMEGSEKFVSRGGLKLEHALLHFQIDVRNQTAVDLGASTGGFTDCLLQYGAAKVYAVDVGHGQLAWKLRQDPRVIVMEKTNARHLTAAQVPEPVGAVVCDASFIGLKTILPAALSLAAPGAWAIALIKPQFEVGPAR